MKRLKDWLKTKATSAQVSAKEVAEFASWLVARRSVPEARSTSSDYTDRKKSGKVTASDVTEFMGWLHRGMDTAKFNDSERRQLKDWVTGRMQQDPGLNESSE